MKNWMVVLLILGSVVSAFADYGRDQYLNGSPATSEMTWEKVAEKFKSSTAPKSVEAFLTWVAEDFPYQLKHFTLMRHSQSLQKADPLNPRAIVFGPDAKFIFTFTDAAQVGGDKIEVLHFRDEITSFELREIVFSNDKAEVSEANPAACLQCHGTHPRPIWSAYDVWPGAYGEDDDGLVDFTEKYARTSQTDEEVAIRTLELNQFREFQVKMHGDHSRYSLLQPPEGSPVSPYNTKRRGNYVFRTNLALTDRLVMLHKRQIEHRLASSGECFEVYQPLLVSSLLGCGQLDKWARKAEWSEAVAIARQELRKKYPNAPVGRWDEKNSPEFKSDIPPILTLMGIEQSDWHMEFNSKTWAYFEGGSYLSQILGMSLYDEMGGRDWPPLLNRSPYASSVEYDEYGEIVEPVDNPPNPMFAVCDRLLDEVIPNLAANSSACSEVRVQPSEAGTPVVVKMCLSCHHSGSAPSLNWKASEAKEHIRQRVGLELMPPTRPLNLRESYELESYLNSL